MFTPIESAVVETACLGIVCIAASRILNGTFVSACTLFWVAWLGFVGAAWYCEWQDLFPTVTEGATGLITKGELGAAAGCLIGSIVAGRMNRKQQENDRIGSVDLRMKTLYVWMALLPVAGTLYFLESLRDVGWNVVTLLFDIRMHYLDTGLTPLGRISEYLSASVIPFAILLARRDAREGIRPGPIALLILANLPLGFATGGRGYLVAPIIYYSCAYALVCRWTKTHARPEQLTPRRPIWRIALPILAVCVIFTGLGEWRWGAINERPFYLRVPDTVLGYPAVSMQSIVEFSDIFEQTSGNGRIMADWPATQLERLNVLSTDTREDLESVRKAVYDIYGGAGNNPPTVIPYLIGDVGSTLMPYYFAAIMALAQIATVRLSVSGLFGHAVGTMSLAAVFFTIQGNMFLHSSHCLALLWIGVIAFAKSQSQRAHKKTQSLQQLPQAFA